MDDLDDAAAGRSSSGGLAEYFIVFLLWLGMAGSVILIVWLSAMVIRTVRVLFNV